MTKHQKASPMTAAKIILIGGPTRAHRSRRISPVDRSDPRRAGVRQSTLSRADTR
jgi:hypothetical protein